LASNPAVGWWSRERVSRREAAGAGGVAAIGIAAARPAVRRGRADIVVSTLVDADIAVLAAAWLAMRRAWERDDGHVTGSG
jgi:hypothetical protein